MFLTQYVPTSARDLAASLATGAAGPSPTTSQTNLARVLEMDGWRPTNWRTELRRLVEHGTVVALTMRTTPDERQLTDERWAQISRGMARRIGLAKQPWIAVRTSATTVALLAQAPDHPLRRAAGAAFAAQVTIRNRLHSQVSRDGIRTDASKTTLEPTTASSPCGITQLSFTTPPDARPDTAATTPEPGSGRTRPPTPRPHIL